MAAGELTEQFVTEGEPSLAPMFGLLDADEDAQLRRRVVAARQRLTAWVLTTRDDPPWRLIGFLLVTVEEAPTARLLAELAATEAGASVRATIDVLSPPRSAASEVTLAVHADCRCDGEHRDAHLVASHQLDARNPWSTIDRLDEVVDFTVEHLPNHTSAAWIAKGEDASTAATSWAPSQARQAEGSAPWDDDRIGGHGGPLPRWPR